MNPLCCGCLSPSLFVFFSPVPYCWLPLLHSASSCEGKVYSVFKTCSLFSLVGVKLGEGLSKCLPAHWNALGSIPVPQPCSLHQAWSGNRGAQPVSARGEISGIRFYTINPGKIQTFSHGSNCIALQCTRTVAHLFL